MLVDVNFSGSAGAADVLDIITHLNQQGSLLLTDAYSERPELDIDGNGVLVPRDVLLAINLINALAAGSAQGAEGEAASSMDGESMSVVLRSANQRFVRGANNDYATAIHWPLRHMPDTRDTALVWPASVQDHSAVLDSLQPARAGRSDLLSVLADGSDEIGEESPVDRFFQLLGK